MIYSVIIYGITFAVSLLSIYLYEKKQEVLQENKILKALCILGVIIPPVILATVRYGIGVDYFTYVENYDLISNNFSLNTLLHTYQEPLSVIVYWLAKILFNHNIGFFCISAFLTVGFTVLGIKKYKGKISLPIALLIYFMFYYQISYNAVRQCIAVAIVFFAYQYVIDRKIVKYAICVIVATLFHTSAIICLFFYFLCPRKETKISNKLDIALYISIILSPLIVPFVIKIVSIIVKFSGIYSVYFDKPIDGYEWKFLLYIIPTLLPIFIFKKDILKLDYRYNFFIRLILLQIPFQFAGNYIAYSDRLALYSSVIQIILIPLAISSISEKKKKNIMTIGVIGWYLFYYVGMFIFLNSNVTYPYVSIFMQ